MRSALEFLYKDHGPIGPISHVAVGTVKFRHCVNHAVSPFLITQTPIEPHCTPVFDIYAEGDGFVVVAPEVDFSGIQQLCTDTATPQIGCHVEAVEEWYLRQKCTDKSLVGWLGRNTDRRHKPRVKPSDKDH